MGGFSLTSDFDGCGGFDEDRATKVVSLVPLAKEGKDRYRSKGPHKKPTFRCDAWSPRVSPRCELRSDYTWNRPADCRTVARIATAENGVDDWTIRPLRSPSDQAVPMQCLLARLEKD